MPFYAIHDQNGGHREFKSKFAADGGSTDVTE